MTDTRLTRPEDAGEQRPHQPKHARREDDLPRRRPPDPRDVPPPLTTPQLGNDYRLRGLDLGTTPAPAPAAPRTRPPATRRRARARRRRRPWLIMVGAAITTVVLVAVLLRLTLVTPFTVPSSAMVPTLLAGDRILVVRSSFLTGSIGRGDIVVFHRPKYFPCHASGSADDLVQRVIGLPGETIWSAHQTIYVDGKRVAEHGWYDPRHGAVGSVQIARTTIPQGDYFVLTDNRSNSCDSRSFGVIPASSVLGKVFAVIARNGTPYLHVF